MTHDQNIKTQQIYQILQTETVSYKLEKSALMALARTLASSLRVGVVVVAAPWASLSRWPSPFTGSLSERKCWQSSGSVYSHFAVCTQRLHVSALLFGRAVSFFIHTLLVSYFISNCREVFRLFLFTLRSGSNHRKILSVLPNIAEGQLLTYALTSNAVDWTYTQSQTHIFHSLLTTCIKQVA